MIVNPIPWPNGKRCAVALSWDVDADSGRNPAAVDLILENGHELALHGYLHERSNELSHEDEAKVLERGIEAFVRTAGAKPRGWRAPAFAFSKHSLDLLIGAGFDYDSSLMGDEIPYMLEGDAGRLIETGSTSSPSSAK